MNARIATLEQQMLSLVSSVLDAYTVTLFLPVPSRDGRDMNVCQLEAYFSLGDTVLPDPRVSAGEGLVGWIVANKKPLAVPQFSQQQGGLYYYENFELERIKAFMGCPMPGGGALCADTKRQYSFTDREQRLLQMFAAILSGIHEMGCDSSRLGDIPLYFARLLALDELRAGYRSWGKYISSYLNIVADAVKFDYCALANVKVPDESYAISAENQPVLVRDGVPFYQSMNAGLAGWVFRNGQPVIQDGLEGRPPALFGSSSNLPKFAAVAVLPVIVSKTTKAVLCLGHTERLPMGEAMRTFLKEAVSQLSLHLENLSLRERLRSTMQGATIYRWGPRAHNPNTEPYPVKKDKED